MARWFWAFACSTRFARSILTCSAKGDAAIASLKSSLFTQYPSQYVQAFTVAVLSVDPSKQLSPKKSPFESTRRGALREEEVTTTWPRVRKYISNKLAPSWMMQSVGMNTRGWRMEAMICWVASSQLYKNGNSLIIVPFMCKDNEFRSEFGNSSITSIAPQMQSRIQSLLRKRQNQTTFTAQSIPNQRPLINNNKTTVTHLVPLRLLGKTKDNRSIATPCQERHLPL